MKEVGAGMRSCVRCWDAEFTPLPFVLVNHLNHIEWDGFEIKIWYVRDRFGLVSSEFLASF